MPKSTSEALRDKRIRKYKLQLERRMGGGSSKAIQTWLDNAFRNFQHRPNPSQLAEMIAVSRFGGGNALFSGGQKFLIEYLTKDLNDAINRAKQSPENGEDLGIFGIITSEKESFGLIAMLHEIDERLAQHVGSLSHDQFTQDHTYGPNILIDKDSRSYGLYIEVFTAVDPDESLSKGIRSFYTGDLQADNDFDNNFPIPVFPGSGDLPEGRYISEARVIFSTTEHLRKIAENIERERTGVVEHDRHLGSGKVVRVSSHKRSKPVRSSERQDEVCNHIVYVVRDKDSTIRYVGEGRPDRPLHVNSGISHNFKINEHFFTHGDMTVEIVSSKLSKAESLAIEGLLLRKYAGCGLWNRKDYESDISPDL